MDAFRTTLLALMLAAIPLPVSAQSIESTYSKIGWETSCTIVDQAPEGEGSWARLRCAGYGDTPVHVADGDARMSVDYGTPSEPGGWESFTGFNHVNDTIEWRLADGVPFATIHRWFVDDGSGGSRQVLVVSTVVGRWSDASCMVGYVDANANSNANVIARGLADSKARDFRCGVDAPSYVGVTTDRTPQPSAG
ncbi:hypothetical protein [Amorphus orientalis]|uniref:Uncharacterized protein n=1 Tax=Amorphus orientalis TaxID=649198 RepID=A0AAE4AUP1_9HYPH|nr:hypothetical protein [Amorphus orientalis]MDQ0317625.1 hypothetical protein [Amorphus orientalis]